MKNKNEYFIYNGTRHYIGTQFKMKYEDKIVVAYFSDRCCVDRNMLIIIITDGLKYSTSIKRTEEELCNTIVEIFSMNYFDNNFEKYYLNDFDVPEITISWGIYIILMGISSIFYKRECMWILFTILFFIWRHYKKEDSGVYHKERR